ncbi:unnamed protein product [Clavelina lepadiformis]|uniref:Claudin n=1 Tax=Clavelina lepadiformis TaxID=159417 RepID=A0ABP0FP30_CLALP
MVLQIVSSSKTSAVALNVGLLTAIIGTTLSTVAFSTTGWLYYQKSGVTSLTLALWQQCTSEECDDIAWSSSDFNLARGFLICGLAFHTFAMLLGAGVARCVGGRQVCFKIIIGLFYIVSGVFLLVGGGLFYGFEDYTLLVPEPLVDITETDAVFGYCVYLAFGGAACLVLAGVFYGKSSCYSQQETVKKNEEETTGDASLPAVYYNASADSNK